MSALRESYGFIPELHSGKNSLQLLNTFRENAEKTGAEVYVANSSLEGAVIVNTILTEIKPQRIVAAPSPLIDEMKLERALLKQIITENVASEVLKADVGLFSASLAVAETGSLCQLDPTTVERKVSNLTDVSIALVRTEDLIPTFEEAMLYAYKEGTAPGYMSFITGPSRTSDIERVLTIGAHGPGRLIVIFIGDITGGNKNGDKAV